MKTNQYPSSASTRYHYELTQWLEDVTSPVSWETNSKSVKKKKLSCRTAKDTGAFILPAGWQENTG